METGRHREQMNLLIDSLRDHWAHRRDVYVGGNMFVYFSELQTRKNDFRGPDVFVVLDTDGAKERKSWVVWEEDGQLPDVVIELLSSTTEAVDRGEKKRLYERVWKVSTYVLYDPFTFELTLFERSADGLLVEREPHGATLVPCIGLSLAVRSTRLGGHEVLALRWIDGDRVIPSRDERADMECARADAAEARVRELEAILAKR